MALYSKGLNSFRYKAIFKLPKMKKLANGDVKTVLEPSFTRHAAIHTALTKYIQTIDGFNRTSDIFIAIRSVRNDIISVSMDYSVYTVEFKGVDYVIYKLDPDSKADLQGFHILTLRRKDYAN